MSFNDFSFGLTFLALGIGVTVLIGMLILKK